MSCFLNKSVLIHLVHFSNEKNLAKIMKLNKATFVLIKDSPLWEFFITEPRFSSLNFPFLIKLLEKITEIKSPFQNSYANGFYYLWLIHTCERLVFPVIRFYQNPSIANFFLKSLKIISCRCCYQEVRKLFAHDYSFLPNLIDEVQLSEGKSLAAPITKFYEHLSIILEEHQPLRIRLCVPEKIDYIFEFDENWHIGEILSGTPLNVFLITNQLTNKAIKKKSEYTQLFERLSSTFEISLDEIIDRILQALSLNRFQRDLVKSQFLEDGPKIRILTLEQFGQISRA